MQSAGSLIFRLKYFWFTLVLGCLFFLFFNLYIDPGNRWFRSQFHFTQNWQVSDVMLAPKEYNDRAYVNAHLGVISRPDVVALGSSKATLIDSSMFASGIKFHTLGVSSGSAEDFAAFWQELKEFNKLPKLVLLFIDPFVFNKSSEQFSWHTNLAFYNRFLSDKSTLKLKLKNSYWQVKHFATEVYDLLSWATFKESLQVAYKNLFSKKEELFQIIPEKNFPKESWGRRGDGSVRYPYHELFEVGAAKLDQRINEFVTSEKVFMLHSWQYTEEPLGILKKLLADIKAHGVSVMVIAPAYHRKAVSALSKRPGYETVFAQYQAGLEKLAQAEQVPFCNALNAEVLGCSSEEFMDAQHWQPSCARKVLRFCFLQNSSFKKFLPQAVPKAANLDPLKNTRAFR